jgi:hypothetical protein
MNYKEKCYKIAIAVLLVVSNNISAFAQEFNPIRWKITTNMVSKEVYEVHMLAKIDAPWHIYSQNTSSEKTFATQITLAKNPLLTMEGNPKEVGTLETKNDVKAGVILHYYTGLVEFVQTVKIKRGAKTRLNGTIEYMLCTDERCLPPATKKFSVLVGE